MVADMYVNLHRRASPKNVAILAWWLAPAICGFRRFDGTPPGAVLSATSTHKGQTGWGNSASLKDQLPVAAGSGPIVNTD